ncbi:MAG TPA: hypothetical protein VM282_02430 [Acidimicrobiales bacterium]|nr:hypothetical protein [Acidimicrobiales bacterium]
MLMIDAALTDDELAELALAADPRERLEPDAVPLAGTGNEFALLPQWYMPAPIATARSKSRWCTVVAIFLVGAFATITALGFCITYGRLEGV